MAPKVLFVLSSYGKLPNNKPTGWYLPEFAHPYDILESHTEIVVASPNGGEAPLDPGSVEIFKEDPSSIKFLKKESLWQNTHKLSEFLGRADEFDAIFYVGGHGPMFDLAKDETSHKLINEFWSKNKIVSAVCHGPAALAYVKLPSGQYFLSGQTVTGFSDAEEDQNGSTADMPFSLEAQLKEASEGKYVKAEQVWGAKVVVAGGGRILTGQNPASAAPLGQAVYDAIFGEETTKDEV